MYNWIESTFNVSGGATQVIAAVLALIAVLLLFSIFVFVLKRLTGANAPQNRSRQPRIAVMDSTNVDARRQLVLIRRDNVEHLLLVGGPSDVVVEQNIVRNAPVAAQRQVANPPAAGTGTGTMKMPTAPGPDIPAKPDDGARQPVAALVRQDPVPAVPLKPRVEPNVRPAPKPVAANTLVRPVSPPKNEDKTPPVVAPVPPAVSNQTQEKESGARPDRAADLLRAATQNGFNRSTSAVQGTKENEAEEPAIGTAPKNKDDTAVGAAPKVEAEPVSKPAPEPDIDKVSPENDEGASAPLRSLGRSIAARERSTQAVHSISPPSSGPAARAKTALLQPVQAPSEPDESGFVFKEQTPAEAETAPVDPTGSAGEGDGVRNDGVKQEEEKPTVSELFENTERFDWKEDEPAETIEADSLDEDAPAEKEQATSEEEEAAPPRELKLDLEMDDLIDIETPEPQKTGPSEDASITPDPNKKDPQMQSGGSAPHTNKQSATLDIVPGAEPASRQLQGLGDKNPIEDEMAKILFELGGQQNR